ncbi:MAG: DUF3990 domain-containing protein [Lachnospiraceae bacterium]
MGNIPLYHGSEKIISNPSITMGVLYNDFGPGFYCTRDPEEAARWACHRSSSGFVNEYIAETDGLNVLDLSSKGMTLLHWLAVVLTNRAFRITSPNADRFINHLNIFFRTDAENADIIVGQRCDDSYFSFVRMFLDGRLSYERLKDAMAGAARQTVIRSEAAFERIRFVSCSLADADIHYPKRKATDDAVRERIFSAAERPGDLYMHSIIREEVMPDDPRL